MNELEKYYEESLYPLQDGILNIVRDSGTPFFLTGGTALSRYYTHHRYSDDLDFFVVNDSRFSEYVGELLRLFIDEEINGKILVDRASIRQEKDYSRLFVLGPGKPEVTLKIDLINDVASHYGKIINVPIFGRIDSIENILSNKLTALLRTEPKDVTDIHIISMQYEFNWQEVVAQAKTKEVGIEPNLIYDLLRSFPLRYLDNIKWITNPDRKQYRQQLAQIADDILFGRDNSLWKGNVKP